MKPCTLDHRFFRCFILKRMTKWSRNAQMESQECHKYKALNRPRLNNLKRHAKDFLQKSKLASICHLRSKQQQMFNLSFNLSWANGAAKSHNRPFKVRAALRIRTRYWSPYRAPPGKYPSQSHFKTSFRRRRRSRQSKQPQNFAAHLRRWKLKSCNLQPPLCSPLQKKDGP